MLVQVDPVSRQLYQSSRGSLGSIQRTFLSSEGGWEEQGGYRPSSGRITWPQYAGSTHLTALQGTLSKPITHTHTHKTHTHRTHTHTHRKPPPVSSTDDSAGSIRHWCVCLNWTLGEQKEYSVHTSTLDRAPPSPPLSLVGRPLQTSRL